MFSLSLCRVLFGYVNTNTLPAYFYGIWKVSFSKESMFWCLQVKEYPSYVLLWDKEIPPEDQNNSSETRLNTYIFATNNNNNT